MADGHSEAARPFGWQLVAGLTGWSLLVLVSLAQGQDAPAGGFAWSWEKGKDAPASESAAATTGGAGFAWSWEQSVEAGAAEKASPAPATASASDAPAPVAVPAPVEPPVTPPTPAQVAPPVSAPPTAAGGTAYQELVNENLELRRRIESASQAETALRGENERLAGEMGELEKRVAQSLALIADLRRQTAGESDKTRLRDLEQRVQSAEAERVKLTTELGTLRRQLEQRPVPTPTPAVAAAPAPVSPVAPGAPAPGSDLFRRMERENLELKQRLAAVESEKTKAEASRQDVEAQGARTATALEEAAARQRNLESELATARQAAEQARQELATLNQRVPELEQALRTASANAESGQTALQERERELQALREELQRREHRQTKAERMATLLEQTRAEIRQANDRERRDMHYNMASVYAREGRAREAELEYLKALRLDPTDPDIHYNLGILYDDSLGDKARAAMHYRRYLQLAPNAPDHATVRAWLLRIEMAPAPRR